MGIDGAHIKRRKENQNSDIPKSKEEGSSLIDKKKHLPKWFVWLAFVMVFLFIYQEVTQQKTKSTTIPSDLIITVINESTKRDVKRQLEVVLSRKVSADVLKAIAYDLKGRDPQTYEKTFISYRIAGIDGGGFWAQTHFSPNLEVKILGIDAETERSLLEGTPGKSDRDIVGVWLEDRTSVENRIEIYRKNQTLYIERTYADRSSGIDKLTEETAPNGVRLFDRPNNEYGEYYLLTNDGNLQYWNKTRNYYTAKKIR